MTEPQCCQVPAAQPGPTGSQISRLGREGKKAELLLRQISRVVSSGRRAIKTLFLLNSLVGLPLKACSVLIATF